MIYFIKCNEFVKIGRGAMPEDRLNALQVGNPYTIELLGAYDGSDAEERRIHDAFVQFRHHGEWYYLSEAIKIFVNKHCSRRNVLNLVPRPAKASAREGGDGERGFGAWWSDDVVECDGVEIGAGRCHEAYKAWCKMHGKRALSPRDFGLAVKGKLGVARVETRRKYTYYKGVSMRVADAA